MTAVNWVDRWAGEEGRHWRAEAARYDEINRAFGEALIDAARLVPGERVLDVGCGAGAVALEAALRVRPGGSVLGVDVSPDLLAVARERLASAGAAEVELVEADAGLHPYGDGGFDVVVSRNGVMFFGDPDGAFANLARALRPGGRIAFTAPQGLERNPWIMVAGAAAAPHVGLPSGIAPGQPGPLGLADPTRIEAVLGRAGFIAVAIEELTASIRIGADVEDALAFIRSMPIVRDLLAAAPPLNQAAALEAVEQALIRHAGPDGIVLHGNGAWLVTAQRERKNPSQAAELGAGGAIARTGGVRSAGNDHGYLSLVHGTRQGLPVNVVECDRLPQTQTRSDPWYVLATLPEVSQYDAAEPLRKCPATPGRGHVPEIHALPHRRRSIVTVTSGHENGQIP